MIRSWFHLKSGAGIAAFLLSAPSLLIGQRTAATLSGTITDPAGAVVSGAHVTAVNTATGLKVEARSNDAGFYVIPNLGAGEYQVDVNASGFQRAVRES